MRGIEKLSKTETVLALSTLISESFSLVDEHLKLHFRYDVNV